jgi:hypothetical protein
MAIGFGEPAGVLALRFASGVAASNVGVGNDTTGLLIQI